jgi:hypothetical protein
MEIHVRRFATFRSLQINVALVLIDPLCFFYSGVRVMAFNATFNNISVISRQSVLLMEKNTDLPQVTDHCIGYIVAVSFIGGRNLSQKSLTTFIT